MQPVKAYLRKIREEQRELRTLERMLREARLQIFPPGIRYDLPKVQTSPKDSMASAAEICVLEKEIEIQVRALDARKAEAAAMIAVVDDSLCRQVLELYYLTLRKNGRLMRWCDVADEMGYSEDWVKHTHGKALNELKKSKKI